MYINTSIGIFIVDTRAKDMLGQERVSFHSYIENGHAYIEETLESINKIISEIKYKVNK